jgi:putative ABC transport system permease protein
MIVQFGVFLTLISCSLGIYQQIHFSRHHDLGFEPRGVIHFSIGSRTDKEATFHALKNELLQIPGIDEVGGSVWLFPTSNVWSMDVSTPGGPESSVSLNAFYVDSDLPDVMGLDLIEGEPFSSYSSENENLVLINETARRRLGFDDPMGQELGGYRIIGVIRDFHYNSFRQKIPPMMLIRGTHNIQQMLVKLPEEADNRKMISAIEAKYQKVVGPERMEYGYLIDRFDQIYRAERKLAVLLAVLSGIAIFIASMGLLGLTIFQTRKKTREIAIRKINGARIRHVMVLLSGNFVKLILIAALVATPLSYWILQRWLREFAYQTSLSWVLFAVAVALALVITLVTVSYQTWRAAIANPAESLRHE